MENAGGAGAVVSTAGWSGGLVLQAESEGYWQQLRVVLTRGHINGPQVHAARVAAICLLHGAQELWTVDRDFGRFPALTVRNPLVG